MPATVPEIVYATFSGQIDQGTLDRIFRGLTGATQGGARVVHVLFQSTGGNVDESIALHNFLRVYPLELHFYNGGAVQSGATLAWLAVQHRHVSVHGRFMLHKSTNSGYGGGNALKFRAIADSLVADDTRSENIVKAYTQIPLERWALYATHQDLILNSQEAVQFGIAQDIREFEVPPGNQIFNL